MDEIKRPLLALVAIIVIVSSLISIYLTQNPRLGGINLLPFEAIGDVLAEETKSRLPQGGNVLLLTQELKLAMMKAPVERFRKGIEDRPNLVLLGTEELVLEFTDGCSLEMMAVNGDRFLGLLAEYPEADLVISLIGPPTLDEAQSEQLKQAGVKVYVVSSLDSGLKQLIASGLVELAILPRYLPPEPTDDEPITRRDWFDRLYTVATLANVDDLP